MKREDVDALLLDIDLTADEHKCQPADVTFEIEGDILAALCRRWLAVEDAQRVEVTHWEQAGLAKAGMAIPDEGSFVRIVPEHGEE